jgi:hypothetical protein
MEATMTRLQYKICVQVTEPGENSWDLVVYQREVDVLGEELAWRRVHIKRVYVDPMLYTGNRRLKVLLRSLV